MPVYQRVSIHGDGQKLTSIHVGMADENDLNSKIDGQNCYSSHSRHDRHDLKRIFDGQCGRFKDGERPSVSPTCPHDPRPKSRRAYASTLAPQNVGGFARIQRSRHHYAN